MLNAMRNNNNRHIDQEVKGKRVIEKSLVLNSKDDPEFDFLRVTNKIHDHC